MVCLCAIILSLRARSLQFCKLPHTRASVHDTATTDLQRAPVPNADPRAVLTVPRAIRSLSVEPLAQGTQPTGRLAPLVRPDMPSALAIRPQLPTPDTPMDILVDPGPIIQMDRRSCICGPRPPPALAHPRTGTTNGHHERGHSPPLPMSGTGRYHAPSLASPEQPSSPLGPTRGTPSGSSICCPTWHSLNQSASDPRPLPASDNATDMSIATGPNAPGPIIGTPAWPRPHVSLSTTEATPTPPSTAGGGHGPLWPFAPSPDLPRAWAPGILLAGPGTALPARPPYPLPPHGLGHPTPPAASALSRPSPPFAIPRAGL